MKLISNAASDLIEKLEAEYGIQIHSRQMLALIDYLVQEGVLTVEHENE